MDYFRFAAENARAMAEVHIRCKCGVPMNNKDKALYCEFSETCPRSHEHDPVKWARIQEQAEGGRT